MGTRYGGLLATTVVVLCASAWAALALEPEAVRGLPVCRDDAKPADGQACLWYGPQPVRPTFEAFTKAQEAIEAKRYDEAYWILDALIDDPKLNPYERASVMQSMAFLHAEQENYTAAARVMQRSIDLRRPDGNPALPESIRLGTRYTIGQLYMAIERHADAANALDTWLAEGGTPRTRALPLLATARFRLGEFDKALAAIDEAIASSPAANEQWTRLKAAIV